MKKINQGKNTNEPELILRVERKTAAGYIQKTHNNVERIWQEAKKQCRCLSSIHSLIMVNEKFFSKFFKQDWKS